MIYKVYDVTNSKEVKSIYKAYEGKIFEPYITSNGCLCFRCLGIAGLRDGDNHESYIKAKLGIEHKVCRGVEIDGIILYEDDVIEFSHGGKYLVFYENGCFKTRHINDTFGRGCVIPTRFKYKIISKFNVNEK